MRKSIGLCDVFGVDGKWYFEMSTVIGSYVVLVGTGKPFVSKRNAIRSAKNFAKKLNIDVHVCEISLEGIE